MSSNEKQAVGIAYDDAWLVDGCRTGFGAFSGTLADISATDLGIAVTKALFNKGAVSSVDIDNVFTASLAPSDFDAFYLPRHISLYSGVGQHVPVMQLQRLCGSGFELVTQASRLLAVGKSPLRSRRWGRVHVSQPGCQFYQPWRIQTGTGGFPRLPD
ncbi:MAG: hypothetical protein R3E73_11210 [Porticoccaceae bacterium]